MEFAEIELVQHKAFLKMMMTSKKKKMDRGKRRAWWARNDLSPAQLAQRWWETGKSRINKELKEKEKKRQEESDSLKSKLLQTRNYFHGQLKAAKIASEGWRVKEPESHIRVAEE
ncbi:unnamed protein product [Pleuronectes platessa]|uniref:Uncharacterized protein n=1 Tax=Pleuronectes platessa TaxID=8262 RepID=A0A9N7VE72_PLEPL|nr:unnamed protein product [Pleuronectes platessa]